MYPYDTVIFDLDGTLLNTLQDLADSTNYALALQGMPARTLEEVRRFVGNGVGRLIHRAVPEGTPTPAFCPCWTVWGRPVSALPWCPTNSTVR